MGGSQAAARRALGPGSGAEWSTGGSSGTGTGTAPGPRRSSLDEAAACVEEQRAAHTVQRRMHENNKKLAVDEQRLVEEEVRARRAAQKKRWPRHLLVWCTSARAMRLYAMESTSIQARNCGAEWDARGAVGTSTFPVYLFGMTTWGVSGPVWYGKWVVR